MYDNVIQLALYQFASGQPAPLASNPKILLNNPMFSRITQIILGCIVAALALEGVLHLTNNKQYNAQLIDPATGLTIYKPGIRYTAESSCFENTTIINNLGFNARAVSAFKPVDTFRIVVVGGSFVEAFQLPQEQNFARVLEARLNADPKRAHVYEVIPLGMSGNGAYLAMLYFAKYGAALKPDLIIDFATQYEITRDASGVTYPPRFDASGAVILDLPNRHENKVVSALRSAQKNSKLLMSLYFRRAEVESAAEAFISKPKFFGATTAESAETPTELPSEELWNIEEKILTQFSELSKNSGAQFLLTSWFSPGATPELEKKYIEHYKRFSYVDLTPLIAAHAGNPIWKCDNHWNADGHAWAADALFEFLRAHPKLIGL